MLTILQTLNDWADRWSTAVGSILWQSTLLIVLAAVVAWCLRRSSPVVRYWLWQIVAIKLLLMPFWTSYVPLPTWAGSRPVAQSETSQPMPGPVEDSGRLAIRPPSGLTERPNGDTTPYVRSLWEPFAIVTWQSWLLLIWFAVVVWQLVRLLNQRFRLARVLQGTVPIFASAKMGLSPLSQQQSTADNEDLAGLVAELAGQLGLRRVPPVVSVAADCPVFVCGLWQPRLVLPSRLMASLDRPARRQVVLHELAHIKRRDLAWGWPVEIARIVYFFHPLVYWVAYQVRLERELACDQLAMARSGHPPADYAQTLVQVVTHASEPEIKPRPAVAAALTGSVGQRPVDSPSPGCRPGERRHER